jgi:class 3 adenylate cyclase/tetratricopeptide (TPR) repeat protein
MRCAQCQSENPSTGRFCSSCGAPLAVLCPTCTHANSLSNKYCSACGSSLGGLVLAEGPILADGALVGSGERRQATVMFSDVSGYTALTEHLDPEEVHNVLIRVKQAATRIIRKYGGTVNQFVGDEVLALFGIPTAADDDPAHAIKAAMELHAEIRAGARGLSTPTGERLAIHTGINTGLIVAEYNNDREGLYRLTGYAVNTAARLRSLAGADEILIGPNTQRLVKFYFEMQPRPAVLVKGRTAPIVPYRIVAESQISSRFEAARERGFKNYIGRARELDQLQSCFAQALAGTGQFVTVEGEPGIGKSRLLYEFLSSLDREQVTVPQGRCQSHASEIPYFPFLDGLRRGLHLSENDSHADTRQKAVSSIRRIDSSLEQFLPHLLHLLSIPSDYALPAELKGEALRRAMEEAIAAIITLTTKTQPMVLVIEDWHWSDPASQSALCHLLRLVASHRLMIVVSYRSEYEFNFGQAGARRAIKLNPLSERETEDLIRAVTASVELPEGLGALICQSADGNPLFVEEACYSLLESGTISVEERRLILHKPLSQLLLPETVQAVIRARLDRLYEDAKEVVGPASVIGRSFNQRVLARIFHGRASLEKTLGMLQAQGIIYQTKILPHPEYSFRHMLTREVAYDTLLLQQRKRLHEAVGRAIEELYPERLSENAPILTYHYTRSQRADKAVQYALLAGDWAAHLYANAEAATYFDDALTIAKSLPKSPEALRWQIDAVLGQVAVGTAPRDMERDRRHLQQACALAERLGDRRRLAQVLYWLGRNHYALADLAGAIEHAQRSLEVADELGNEALAAPPANLMGRAYWQLSDFTRSAQMMERSVVQMRLLGNKSEESTAAGFVSALFGYMGKFEKALSYSDLAIKLAQELKNPYAEAAGFHYRGIIRDQQGLWDRAIDDYATALKIAEKSGDMFRVYIVRFMEGRATHMMGDPDRGRVLIEDALLLASKIGTTFLLGQAKCFLAACYLAAGRVEEAHALCADAISLAEKAGDKFTESLVLRARAECLGQSGPLENTDEAERTLLEAIKIQDGIGAKPELARSYLRLARLFRSRGGTRETALWLDRATGQFRELGMSWDIALAR